MFSAIILICSVEGCRVVSPPVLFKSEDQCMGVVVTQIEVAKLSNPENSYLFKCVHWGIAT